MSQPAEAQVAVVPTAEVSPGTQRTCLVVDDSRVVRRIARGILEAQGFAIVEAEDGQKALEAVRAEMPHAILLDWNMPVMNGIEFLRALKSEFGDTAAPVVFCTTENEMSFILEAMGAGATEYIMKPFDAEILASKFEQAGLL
ncbi:response regulator [Elioraea sp.]|uniref:response regulator n=1 Tax=Elioraea sp. TaxID=2185103 RepID=UPI0025BC35C1|nr:response regulator [Elioraea sp.]